MNYDCGSFLLGCSIVLYRLPLEFLEYLMSRVTFTFCDGSIPKYPEPYNRMFVVFHYIIRCDANLLLATLSTRTIQTREGVIIKALDCDGAVSSRDALAKTVYARLFEWYALICPLQELFYFI